MIAIWMMYALAVAAMIGLGAVLLERGLRLANASARWIWVIAISASVGLPAVGMMPSPDSPAVSVLEPLAVAEVGALPGESRGVGVERLVELLAAADTVLLAIWIAVSAILLFLFLWTQVRLHRDARRWPVDVVANTTVRRAPRTGPAVVGWLPAFIVLPEWARELENEAQRLILLHEREHCRAGDTGLLTAALLLVVLLPWNIALWWQLLRLRTAVELDCDRRVLAHGVDARSYATVLLDVAGRRRAPWTLSLGVADFPSLLARRIAMMTADRTRTWGAHALLAVTLGTVLVVAACETPTPPPLMSSTDPSLVIVSERGTNDGKVTEAREVLREAELEKGIAEDELGFGDGSLQSDKPYLAAAVDEPPRRLSGPAPTYPALLRRDGIEGEVAVEFLIDRSGHVVDGSVQVLKSTNAAFEAPARDAIQRSVFQPGRVDGEPVRVLVQQAVKFSVAADGKDRSVPQSRDADEVAGRLVRITGASPIRPSSESDGQPLVDEVAGHLVRITGASPIRPSSESDGQPLVLVDGRELAPEEFESLTPDVIERIEVLKGTAASNQYGERGANGVILITLKRQ